MRLKLSENKIRTIVNESIKKVLTENFFGDDYHLYYDANDYNNNEIEPELVTVDDDDDVIELEVADDDDVFFGWYIELNLKKMYSPTKFNTIYEAKADCDKMLEKLNFCNLSDSYQKRNTGDACMNNSIALIGTVDKKGKWLKNFYMNYGLGWFKYYN